MARFILRRLAGLIFVLLGVSILTFFLAQIVPVDPAATALGSNAREEQIQAYRQQLGLDQPAPVQYLAYMGRLLRGDLGQSIRTRRPVIDDLLDYLHTLTGDGMDATLMADLQIRLDPEVPSPST